MHNAVAKNSHDSSHIKISWGTLIMDKKIVLFLSALLSSLASHSFADGYAYLATGVADFDGEETDNSVAMGVGFDLIKHLAFELNFTNFGAVTDMAFNNTEIELKAETLSLAAVGLWDVADNVTVFGKLGVDVWEARITVPQEYSAYVNTEEGVAPYLSVGARYKFTEQLGAMAEYQLHQFDIGDTDVSMNNFMVGIELYF